MTADTDRGGLLDNALTGTMAALALYASAKSVSADASATIFVALAIAGTVFSALIGRFLGRSKLLRLDGLLYFLAAVAIVYFQPTLNAMMPEPVFTEQLKAPGIISWMVVFGSFLAWRDGTQIFQAVPCISLFGLVGVYNSYANAVPLFFTLLLLMATLFARIHRRSMLALAARSGFTRLHSLDEDAWRWMAGPEWALASAFGVVCVSLIGAPVVQSSVHSFLGTVPLNVRRPNAQRTSLQMTSDDGVNSTIGLGPRNIVGRRMYLARLDQPRYLRIAIFASYTGRGWISAARALHDVLDSNESKSEESSGGSSSKIADPRTIEFKITPLSGLGSSFPVPGEVIQIDSGGKLARLSDGTYQFLSGFGGISAGTITGHSVVPADETKVSPDQPDSGSTDAATLPAAISVVALAQRVTEGIPNKFEKALAIKREIERRCMYDLNAPATPPQTDPVQYFLMDSHVGYCDLFASSMTLMARSVGIAARYVVGYYPVTNEKDAEGRFVLRDSDMHAWAELYFVGVGWIPFDATEGAVAVPGGERGGTTVHTPWYAAAWVMPTVLLIPCAVGLAFAGVGFRRSLRERTPSQIRRTQIGRNYESFVVAIQRATGIRREPCTTPDEFLHTASHRLGDHRAEAAAITARFVAALYAPGEPDAAILAALKADVRQFVKATRRMRPPHKKRRAITRTRRHDGGHTHREPKL